MMQRYIIILSMQNFFLSKYTNLRSAKFASVNYHILITKFGETYNYIPEMHQSSLIYLHTQLKLNIMETKVIKSLESFVEETIKMDFDKLGTELLDPNKWETSYNQTRFNEYLKCWNLISEVHSDLFELLQTIRLFKKLKEVAK